MNNRRGAGQIQAGGDCEARQQRTVPAGWLHTVARERPKLSQIVRVGTLGSQLELHLLSAGVWEGR